MHRFAPISVPSALAAFAVGSKVRASVAVAAVVVAAAARAAAAAVDI